MQDDRSFYEPVHSFIGIVSHTAQGIDQKTHANYDHECDDDSNTHQETHFHPPEIPHHNTTFRGVLQERNHLIYGLCRMTQHFHPPRHEQDDEGEDHDNREKLHSVSSSSVSTGASAGVGAPVPGGNGFGLLGSGFTG
jgi:hypothetical protein